MKHLYLLLFTVFFSFQIHAQQAPFITTWEVTVGNLNITIPTFGTGYNYTADFGDGTTLTNQTGDASHTYAAPGVYTVTISGNFPRIRFGNNHLNAKKIKSVEQWGDIEWVSMESAFMYCTYITINATDAPDLSTVTDMFNMFAGCNDFNQSINHWDVSNITNMSSLFGSANFNQPLNNWDVSNVTNMARMFGGANAFNQPLNNWDVSNVTNMYSMFKSALDFNQPLNNWNVSNVTNMWDMFSSASSFNQPLDNWDVSSVTNMHGLFNQASNFNQDLSNWNFNPSVLLTETLNRCGLNISNYESLLSRFVQLGLQNKSLGAADLLYCDALSRNELINNRGWFIWLDLPEMSCNITYPPNVFVSRWKATSTSLDIIIPTTGSGYNYTIDYGDGTIQNNLNGNAVHTYTQPGIYTVIISGDFPRINNSQFPNTREKLVSIEQWGDIEWKSMEGAFYNCSNLVVNATDLPDLSQVSNMAKMFRGALKFNSPIDLWDVSNVTDMHRMFMGAYLFNQPLNSWDVSNVTDMSEMFSDAQKFNQPIDNWNVGNVTNLMKIFESAYMFNSPINSWNVSNVTNMYRMFYSAKSFNQPIGDWNVSNMTNMSFVFDNAVSFNQPLNDWDVSNVTVMDHMFLSAVKFNQSLNNWDVSNVTDMLRMFSYAESFNSSIENWNVSNVTNMSNMFAYAKSFNQPLNNWNVSNATNLSYMFYKAFAFNQPINTWDVSNVTEIKFIFNDAYSFNQSIDNWVFSNGLQLGGMFYGAHNFNQPLNNLDVSKVTSINFMFADAASFNQPLDNWDVSNVIGMRGLFKGATSFNQPLDNWDVSNVITMGNMFNSASSFNQDISTWNFNEYLFFDTGTFFVYDFLSYSGLDQYNYDAVLLKFAQLGLENKKMEAHDMYYCNSGVRDHLINNLGWTITGDSLGVDECSLNIVQGNILYDQNNDGCDPNDMPVNNIIINANDGNFDFATISDSNGDYILYLLEDTYTISLLNLPNYFTTTPVTSTINFVGVNNVEELNFCFTANQPVEDLNITLLPTSEARPGFEADYRLVVRNVGTETIANVEAILVFDDLMQQFVIANPVPTATTANTLTFSIGSMQPFQKFEADITILTFQPPTVNGDDILHFIATVTPAANDFTPNDNTFILAQVVVNSYDPNDKQVLQGEELHIDDIDEYLDYLIRFQNTGTASAINVRILDTLHPKLDWNTLTPISASHDYYVNITDGNRVEFMFDNIHLPDSLSNEPESHGFIAYKIKPKSNVQVGDVISGDAAIYFDFNAPIITNMVHTTVVEPLSITDVYNPLSRVILYPNPTNKTLNIHLTDGIELKEVLIYDLQGKEVKKVQGKETTLDVEHLRSGMYLLKITTNRGTINRQLVKN